MKLCGDFVVVLGILTFLTLLCGAVTPPGGAALGDQNGIPSTCVGDCNDSGAVTTDEILGMVSIALGNTPCCPACPAADLKSTGKVTIAQVITAVNNALNASHAPTPLPEDTVVETGRCKTPRLSGLVPCDAGTRITAWRCEDRSTCLTSTEPGARTKLGEGTTDACGSYSIPVSSSFAQSALLFTRDEDPDGYTGPPNYGCSGLDPFCDNEDIDPSSEAGVRLVDQKGLQNLSHDGIAAVLQAVRAATQNLPFAGRSPSEAANDATTVASENTTVQETIQQNAFAGTICLKPDDYFVYQFHVTVTPDTNTNLLTAKEMKVDLAVLYQGLHNPIGPWSNGSCSSAFGLWGPVTSSDQPGAVHFTLLRQAQIPTSPKPLFSCAIDRAYDHPIVVSCLSGSIDGLPLRCGCKPFQTEYYQVLVPPGNGCCQFSNSCVNVSAGVCTNFSDQALVPFAVGFRCDHGEGCNEQ